jgi:hypothetical protein
LKYLTVPTFIAFLAFFLLLIPTRAHSFDYDEPILTVTDFLDSLTYTYEGFNFKFRGISIGETYDDNVTLRRENRTDDFITDISAGIGVAYRGRTNTFDLAGNLYYQIFAKNSQFNNLAGDIALDFGHEFSKTDRISLKNVFYYSEAPLFFRRDFFDEQFERIDGRFNRYNNRFTVNYQKDVSKHITGTLRYVNSINAFSGVDIPASYLNTAGIEVSYLLGPATHVFLAYDFTDIRFEDNRSAMLNTVTTGVRRYITRKIYLDGAVGVDFIESFDDEKFTRPVYQASLGYDVDERTNAVISFQKKNDTNPYRSDIFNQWRVSVDFRRQLLERFGCSLSAFYGEGEFVISDVERKLFGGRSVFTYDINKNLKGNLTYSYSEINSNISASEYTKNTVFLGLVAEF